MELRIFDWSHHLDFMKVDPRFDAAGFDFRLKAFSKSVRVDNLDDLVEDFLLMLFLK